MTNPDLKKNDKIILKKSNCGYSKYEGEIINVVNPQVHQTSCKTQAGQNLNVYHGTGGYTADKYVLADRKEQSKALKEQLGELKVKMKEIETDIKYLEMYETEEDAVADKLCRILNAKDSKKKMANLLRELKTSDYL